MILVYSDSQICDIEWIPNLRWNDTIEVCHNIQEYLESQCETKIAFTAHRLHVMHDVDMAFEHKVLQLSAASRCVFSLESELHPFHFTIWSQCHRENVYWLLPGSINGRDDINDNIIYWGDWFKTTVELYRHFPDIVEDLHQPKSKPKFFEALLGSPKPHRDFVANAVVEHGLKDKFILTYGGRWSDDAFYAQDYFIYEPGTEVVNPDRHLGTMDWARYRGHQCHLSQIIPTQVFNDSYYSIIAETDYLNSVSFFSEKTVKPIIAQRLFVAFSGVNFLANLRRLGFKTFQGIIDESYDSMPNGIDRWNAAFEQIKFLCQADPVYIRDQIQPIVEHNFRVMMETDWNQYARDSIQAVIDQRLS